MSDLQRRIEYVIESEAVDDAAAKIAGMLEAKDRHVAKLAQVGMAQETEIAALKAKVVEYAKDALLDTISDISETYWAASWQQGIVAAIKKAVTDPAADRRVWGRMQLSDAEVTVLRGLAEDAGGWPDDT